MKTSGAVALATGLVLLASLATTTQLAGRAVAAASLPRTTLTAVARDLGTLGGRRSEAVDIDGNIVVGNSLTTAGPEHAFAYDLSTSTMRDLGTLGGPSSTAVAVDGNIVAGSALTSGLKWHAFAYDLTTSTMRDLGALSDGFSFASDVDGAVVVGRSGGACCGPGRAFAYDLAASAPTMRDLGTLGTDHSEATAIDGSTVVGLVSSGVSEYRHAFAYDLSTSTMRDLGDLGFPFSSATDVDGGLVVGSSLTSEFGYGDDGRAAFAYDLAAPAPTMRDLGNLGSSQSAATAVEGRTVAGTSTRSLNGTRHLFTVDLAETAPRMRDRGSLGGFVSVGELRDGVVVGEAARAGDGRSRAFAVDLRAQRPAITDLGTLGGAAGKAAAVQGRLVVGSSTPASSGLPHATAWTLRATTAPSFRFGGLRYAVRENARSARVTVLRYGNPSRAVSVTYAARDLGHVPGHDFTPVGGTLRFAAGQVRKTFSVPIRNDARPEPQEEFVLTLRSPTNGAVLGTPSTAGLVIRASDQRPDAWISNRPPPHGFVGNNVYNTTGARQTRSQNGRRQETRVFHVRVFNDGNAQTGFTLRGTGAGRDASVRYRLGSADVTSAMRSHAGKPVTLSPGAFPVDLQIRVTAHRSAAVGSLKTVKLSATWRGDITRTDVVRGVVRVVR